MYVRPVFGVASFFVAEVPAWHITDMTSWRSDSLQSICLFHNALILDQTFPVLERKVGYLSYIPNSEALDSQCHTEVWVFKIFWIEWSAYCQPMVWFRQERCLAPERACLSHLGTSGNRVCIWRVCWSCILNCQVAKVTIQKYSDNKRAPKRSAGIWLELGPRSSNCIKVFVSVVSVVADVRRQVMFVFTTRGICWIVT